MSCPDLDKTVLLVVGASLRAEEKDRDLARRIADEVRCRLGPGTGWRPLIITDVLYLNSPALNQLPAISVGGPGVNKLSAILYQELPSVLTIDNVLVIQMDLEHEDLRCSLWGMDHEQTVEAVNLFLERNMLDHYLQGIVDGHPKDKPL